MTGDLSLRFFQTWCFMVDSDSHKTKNISLNRNKQAVGKPEQKTPYFVAFY